APTNPAAPVAPAATAAPTTTRPAAPGTPRNTPSPGHAVPPTAGGADPVGGTPAPGGGSAPTGGGGTSGAATGSAAQFAQQVVDQVNAERAKVGCKPLTVDARLQSVAQGHSDDMAARDYYEHDTPEGVDPGTRMTNGGYAWQNWGENIYRSPRDPGTAMTGWMNSPEHRDNILDCTFTQTGVGVNLSANGPWWTEDFARPR
ncbi:CAP domain-containing protein, partial [Kitasatospora nipponensis]|uniref:CAP domain-containing protein n=1 Tax=Kitasatospora nipponensis TaxID=258049 RepID=UPI0031DF2FDB